MLESVEYENLTDNSNLEILLEELIEQYEQTNLLLDTLLHTSWAIGFLVIGTMIGITVGLGLVKLWS